MSAAESVVVQGVMIDKSALRKFVEDTCGTFNRFGVLPVPLRNTRRMKKI